MWTACGAGDQQFDYTAVVVDATPPAVLALAALAGAVLLLVAALRLRRSKPMSAEQPSGELAATAAAAQSGRYPWTLSGGVHTPLQAAAARLATAALPQDRLGGGSTLAAAAGVSGLADLLEMVGQRLATRGPAELAAAEAVAYRSGWEGPGWMDTTDLAGGFRPLVHFPNFRLAVSRTGRLQGPVRSACPPPEGWRIATSADLMAAGMRRFAPTKAPKQYNYMDQAGWTCCSWPERSLQVTPCPVCIECCASKCGGFADHLRVLRSLCPCHGARLALSGSTSSPKIGKRPSPPKAACCTRSTPRAR